VSRRRWWHQPGGACQSTARCGHQNGLGSRGCSSADGHGLGCAGTGLEGRRSLRRSGKRLRPSHQPGRRERAGSDGLGELKTATGRAEEAVREFELALNGNRRWWARIWDWQCAGRDGRDEEALERYKQALRLRPRLPEGEFAAALCWQGWAEPKRQNPIPASAGSAAGLCRRVDEPGQPVA